MPNFHLDLGKDEIISISCDGCVICIRRSLSVCLIPGVAASFLSSLLWWYSLNMVIGPNGTGKVRRKHTSIETTNLGSAGHCHRERTLRPIIVFPTC